MAPSMTLSTGIISSIAELLEDQELADFTVIIDDKAFHCHRFILGACSNFFKALFRSEMKEKRENSVKLHGISLSTFELILKILYSGENLVNADNVVNVWQGVHQLQIPFLIEHCEKFSASILSSDNYTHFYRIAKLLASKRVSEEVNKFMLKYFTDVKDEDFFLQLTADELIELIENDALVVDSEDDVLFAIIRWVEHFSDVDRETTAAIKGIPEEFDCENETVTQESKINNDIYKLNKDEVTPKDSVRGSGREENSFSNDDKPGVNFNNALSLTSKSIHFSELLKASRACLASPYCLQRIYNHRLTQCNEEARTIIFNATLYQVDLYRHGYFPPAAMWRNSWEYEHVGVIAYDTGSFQALSLIRNKFYPMPTCSEIKYKVKIALFNKDFYVVGPADDFRSKLCLLQAGSWVAISELPGLRYFLLAHEQYLYVINSTSGLVQRMKPKSYITSLQTMETSVNIQHSELAVSFAHFILVFSNDTKDGEKETSVYCMNSRTEKWHRLQNLVGPAQKMTSFLDGDKTYVLQTNGNLWSLGIDSSETIQFTFVERLWKSKESLRGALLYRDKLFLYLKLPRENPYEIILPSLPGVYRSVQTWARHGYASNFIFTIIHNQDLIEQ